MIGGASSTRLGVDSTDCHLRTKSDVVNDGWQNNSSDSRLGVERTTRCADCTKRREADENRHHLHSIGPGGDQKERHYYTAMTKSIGEGSKEGEGERCVQKGAVDAIAKDQPKWEVRAVKGSRQQKEEPARPSRGSE